MNANGSRFDLLLGRADWGRCTVADATGVFELAGVWDAALVSPPADTPPGAPAWEGLRHEVTLPPLAIELPATPGEAALAPEARRGADADRHGNVYRIADDRRSLRVFSAGSRNDGAFWPAGPADCAPVRARARPDFVRAVAPEAAPAETYLALAVTADDYLVVAFERGAQRGFLSFDLLAGGEPVETRWPLPQTFMPFDMSARHGGGVWLLDRAQARLWELDCRLAVFSTAQPDVTLAAGQIDDFQPLAGAARERPAQTFPGGIDLAPWAADPIAVVALREHTVLLLDRDAAAGRSRVLRLHRDGSAWQAEPSRWLEASEIGGLAHDLVVADTRLYQSDAVARMLFISTSGGNQARAYRIGDAGASFEIEAATELFPLRRYGGRALIAVRGEGRYDSGLAQPVWAPIVQQPRPRFHTRAEFVTPVFDGFELATAWDRALFDGCIPPDAVVRVYSRAGDERSDAIAAFPASPPAADVIGEWTEEPLPQLRATGPELPWLRAEAARATRAESGVGTWELLLQRAHGRYLQLRIVLESASGTATPRLRALRVWSPRFSWPQRFLPAVYREDPVSGPFLERWLANLESTMTAIEDRIVNLRTLFDPRSAPAETLAWLAEWFDVALDPAWDERRRRLFVRRAMDFFRWRGTVHGLRLALELAFDPCLDEAMFDGPRAGDGGARRIRIVEAYQTRLIGAAAAGDPGAVAPGPREVRPAERWTPAEGNAGIVERWARFEGRTATAAELIAPFELVAPLDPALGAAANAKRQSKWCAFCESVLGFVPAVGAAERSRWQAYRVARHFGDTKAAPDNAVAAQLAAAGLPRDEPGASDELEAWRALVRRADGLWTRTRWQDFLALRYRRIERLNAAWQTAWTAFDQVALHDALADSTAAQTDWLQFEGQVLAMHGTAHRFSVLLPLADVTADPFQLEERLGLARRIVELEKPAHTVFDVRFYWAFNRVGAARLGLDTQLGAGSRAPELIPTAVLGRAYVGASFVGGAARPQAADRLRIEC